MGGKASRDKGHTYEREVARRMRELFPDVEALQQQVSFLSEKLEELTDIVAQLQGRQEAQSISIARLNRGPRRYR